MVEFQFKNNTTGAVRTITFDGPVPVKENLSDPALAKRFNDPEGSTYSTVSGKTIPPLEAEKYRFYNKKNT